MNMRVRTKWGQLIIDPEKIYEVRVVFNPWDNVYRVDFVMEGTYDTITADLKDANDLNILMKRIASEIHFVKQYKFKDATGRLQIHEPRRMAALKEKKQQ